MTDPVDPNHPDIVRATEILEEITSLLAAGGFQSEIREPYREYGTEIPGRDLKITHPEVPAYYAAVKASRLSDGTRLVAYSATYLSPGFTRHDWPAQNDVASTYGEIVQFISASYNDFRRDELSHRHP